MYVYIGKMPTSHNSRMVRIERPILDRLTIMKGNLPYDVFISQLLDVVEPFSGWTGKDIDEFVTKFQSDNPELQGKLNKSILGLKAVIKLSRMEFGEAPSDLKEMSKDLLRLYKTSWTIRNRKATIAKVKEEVKQRQAERNVRYAEWKKKQEEAKLKEKTKRSKTKSSDVEVNKS